MSDTAQLARTTSAGSNPVRPAGASTFSLSIPFIMLWILIAAYALLFGWLSLERYWAYDMHALDMGNMGQAAWNTLHGHPFAFTNMREPFSIEAWRTTTRLSFHVEFLYPVISLVYLIYGQPESLLILQTVALALGALPVYLLARDVLRSEWLSLTFALVYLLFPTLQALNLYEFHPVSLATPLLLFAFLFLHRRQYLPFIVCAVAAMGTKEEIGLIVAMFGLYALVTQRRIKLGVGVAIVGVAWSVIAVAVIEHHYRQPGTVTYFQSRYGYLGHGISGALHTVTHDPGVFWRVLMVWPKLAYLERLLAPVGYLALLAPLALLLGLPTFVLNLFSTSFSMYSGVGDNSAELISVIMIAAILGAGWLLRVIRRWFHPRWAMAILTVYLLVQALWSQHVNGFTPIGAAWQVPSVGNHQKIADSFVKMIPAGAPVSTQDELDPHLSSRRYLYLFPDTGRQPPGVSPAYYVLLDVSGPIYPIPSNQLHDIAQSMLGHGWGIAAAKDGLILMETGLTQTRPGPAFYTYAAAGDVHIPNLIRARSANLEILGYDQGRVDLPNHAVPNLAYSFYFRPTARLRTNVEPVVFETMGKNLINCSYHPLGLDWYPTSQWQPGKTYVVRMDAIETTWNNPGTAQLSMAMIPMSEEKKLGACTQLWSKHGKLYPVGTLDIQY